MRLDGRLSPGARILYQGHSERVVPLERMAYGLLALIVTIGLVLTARCLSALGPALTHLSLIFVILSQRNVPRAGQGAGSR